MNLPSGNMAMQRREFMAGMSALAVCVLGSGCKRSGDRAEVLDTLV